MNAFGQNAQAAAQGAEAMQMMQQEARFYIDFVNKITDQCFRKCVARFHDADLNTGEQACVDRCVSKYFDATNKVGEVFQQQMQANASGK